MIVKIEYNKERLNVHKFLFSHQEQAEHLGKLVTGGDFPHLLVYGPPGAGKKTRVSQTELQELVKDCFNSGNVPVEGDVWGWGGKAQAGAPELHYSVQEKGS